MQALGPTDAEFGVVVFAPPSQFRLARATCASVRHFMGDTPICLMVDGEGDARGFEEWGVRVVHAAEVEHTELRRLCFGSLRAKISSLWLAPYERFLYLDADTVVWGDMRRHGEELELFDVVLDRPHPTPMDADEHMQQYILDVDRVPERFPDFDARRHAREYANVGVFLARRGVLDLEESLEVVRYGIEAPETLFWDQGILNLLFFRAADRGALRLKQRQLQVIPFAEDVDDVRRRFRIEDGAPVVDGDPVVLHWAGTSKPRLRGGPGDCFEPAHYFRRRFLDGPASGVPTARHSRRLLLEDAGPIWAHGRSRLASAVRRQRRRVSLALRLRLRARTLRP